MKRITALIAVFLMLTTFLFACTKDKDKDKDKVDNNVTASPNITEPSNNTTPDVSPDIDDDILPDDNGNVHDDHANSGKIDDDKVTDGDLTNKKS